MGRTEDFAKLERAIKDADGRIRAVQVNVEALNKEIANLVSLEVTLEENIKCLKAKQIVAIAQEFKKAKEDLKRTKHRLESLSNDREHFVKLYNDLTNFIKVATVELDRLNKLADKNVLTFKGKKNGQR